MQRASSGRARPIRGPRLLCGAVLLVVGGAVPASAQTSGLVAAYPFEDGTGSAVTDASGMGNAGSIAGATWTTAGRFGKALAFNGSARVTIPDSASLRLTTAMTLEAWVYPSSVTNAWRDVVYKGNDNYYLEATSSLGGPPWAGGTFGEVSGPTALPANTWTHLAVTYDGATLRLYVNGAQVSSAPVTGSIATSTNPLQIGGDDIYGQFFQGTIDEVRVYNVAVAPAQIQSDMNTPIVPVAPDTQPPTAPGPPTATAVGASQINLSWTPSTDNVGVTGYRVERCAGAGCNAFAQIATPGGTSYSDTGLAASTSYSYRVRATDGAGNLGAFSATASATTGAASDTTPPSVPTGLAATAAGSNRIDLSWTASTDNVGVTGYQLQRCQGVLCNSFAQIATPTGTTFSDTGLAANTLYRYRVRATDAAGNLSGYSSIASARTNAADTTPPSAPTNPTATAAGTSQVNLGWTASTDNVGVTGYRVERCAGAGCGSFAQIATPAGTSYVDTGLTAGTTYRYRVRATDAAGNLSAYSAIVSATTSSAPDTTPPSAPGTLAAVAVSNQVNLVWTAATDNVAVTGYRVERCQGVGCGSFAQIATPPGTTYADTGLLASTRYRYRVRATDAAGNLGPYSNVADVDTLALDTEPPTVPGALAATAVSGGQIDLAWAASQDNVAVTGYRVERCQGAGCSTFAQIATPAAPPFSDTGLTAGTTYRYQVRATDAAGNLSLYSNVATATTLATVSGLVAAYGFEEGSGFSVADSSGRNNTGNVTGASWTTGKYGQALAFNGISARVSISDSPSLRLTTAMTLEAWVKPSAVTSAWRDVIYKGDDNYFLEGTSTNQGVPVAGGTFGEVSGGTALTTGAWTHLAVTYDSATLRLYVNGAQVSSVPKTAGIATSTNPLQIGGDSIYGQFFLGSIDEVRVYNVALTPAQIQSDMNTPIGAAPPPPPDTQPPTITVTAPGPGSTLTGSVTLTATASDAGTGVGGVQFQIDGINVGPAINVAPYSVSVSTAAFANGAHSIGAYAWDGAKNFGNASPVGVTFNNGAPGSPDQTGVWSGAFPWPLVAVHAHLMRTGKVLMSDGQGIGTIAMVWDPITSSFTDVSTADNIFCAGHAALGDGRILIAGGHAGGHTGLAVTNIFDPITQSWSSAAPMAYPRWYPTVTTLPDGRVLVTEGEIACDGCNASIPEIYDPATNTWTALPGADLSLPYYPHVFLLPDGRLYAAATSEAPITTSALNIATQSWSVVESSRKDGGSSAMYLPGKILKAGTSVDPDNPPPASASTAYVIDMTQPSPFWRQIASMAFRRTYLTLTLLPDGNVLATGGGTTTNAVGVANGVLPAELWSPTSEAWTTMAAMHAPRLYHSTALLLPDARVLVAGGGRFNSSSEPTDQESGEIFAPPYLFKGPRPAITSAPAQLSYNQTFSVQTPQAASIAKVVLMGTASVTHAINMNQRYVPLTFSAGAGTLTVTAPANANLAPKGYYMLFIIDTNGVPSVATFVNLPGS